MTSEYSEGAPRPTSAAAPADRDEAIEEVLPSVALPSSDDVAFAVCAHWGGFLTAFVAPLILYLIQRDRRSLAAWHAREAFNYQMTLVVFFVLSTLTLGLMVVDLRLIVVPVALWLFLEAYMLVVVIVATIAAVQRRFFRCPLTIPFIPRPRLD